MEIREMDMEQVEIRMAEIKNEIADADEARIADLTKEVEELENRKAEIRTEIENRKAEIAEVIEGRDNKIIEEFREENKPMGIEEIRKMPEYVDAYANYVKTGRDDEVRALLSTNATVATGYVPVPQIVEDRIRTAWDRLGIMELVNKTYIKGNLKVGFELSATSAGVHAEGADAPDAETLTLGVVSLIPASYKKWIEISDECMSLTSENFLYYIYDEITYRIAKAVQSALITKITSASTSADADEVSVAEVDDGAPSLSIVAECIGKLSDEADNPVIVMNKATWSQFKAIQYGANYAVEPFEGRPVFFDNTLPAYSSTATTGVWLIVGDFGRGAQANFPDGQDITLKFDDLSQAPRDIVRIIGREYVALGLVQDKCFCRVTMHT